MTPVEEVRAKYGTPSMLSMMTLLVLEIDELLELGQDAFEVAQRPEVLEFWRAVPEREALMMLGQAAWSARELELAGAGEGLMFAWRAQEAARGRAFGWDASGDLEVPEAETGLAASVVLLTAVRRVCQADVAGSCGMVARHINSEPR